MCLYILIIALWTQISIVSSDDCRKNIAVLVTKLTYKCFEELF